MCFYKKTKSAMDDFGPGSLSYIKLMLISYARIFLILYLCGLVVVRPIQGLEDKCVASVQFLLCTALFLCFF